MIEKSVAIISGGIDSITMLYEYANQINLALSFDYGALINKKEIPFAELHCKKLNIEHKVINLDFVKQNFSSSLLDKTNSSDIVPFRNGIMLAIACGFAENHNYKTVMIANNESDSINFPDCRKDFIDNFSKGMQCGTMNKVSIFAPYMNISKYEIIRRGISLGIDYSETWSCYIGNEIHCGTCHACKNRKEAFSVLNHTDPTIYEK